MEPGAVIGSPLIRRIREALGGATASRSSLARDVGRLADRLERLRRAFTNDRALLDRVELSGHVIGLLGDAGRIPVAAGGGVR